MQITTVGVLDARVGRRSAGADTPSSASPGSAGAALALLLVAMILAVYKPRGMTA